MKYLAYFKPNEGIYNLILSQDKIIVPSSGLHCSLCYLHMEPSKERWLVEDLSRIKFDPFEIETTGFDNFDKNSLVLKLSCPDSLLDLHHNLVSMAAKYAKAEFNEVKRAYFLDNYSPHIRISTSSAGFDTSSQTLIGLKDRVTSYVLVKSLDGRCTKIREFSVYK